MGNQFRNVRWRAFGLFLILGFSVTGAFSQETEMPAQTGAYTLKQCLDYALQNSNAIKTSRFDEFIAQKQVKEYKGIGLPQVRAGFDFQDFEIIPKMVFNGTTFSFGTRFTAKADATVSQLLLDGSFFIGLKAIKELVTLSQQMTERSEIEVMVSVSKAYYNALVNEERAKLLKINLDRLGTLVKNTQAFYDAGFVEKVDVSRLQIAYYNLETEYNKINQLLELGVDLLKFQMGMDINEAITLTDTLNYSSAENLVRPEMNQFDSFNKRIEFSLLDKQQNLQSLNMKRYQMGKYGNLVAYGSFSEQAFRNDFDYFKGGDWFPALLFGFKLNVPIFDGLQTHNKIQQIKLEVAKIDLQRQNLKQAVQLEVKNNQIQLINAWSSMQSMKKNLDLAKEVYQISDTKYKEGVGSNLELIDAESSLRQAETNYLASFYDYLLISIDLKRAKGEITNDPSSVPGF